MRKAYLLFSLLFFIMVNGFAQCIVDTNIINVSCSGSSDGEIEVAVTNGTPPFFYDLDGSMNSTSDSSYIFSGLSSGTYTLQVTDSGSCVDVLSLTVNEPTPVEVTVFGDFVICEGSSTCIDAAWNGGTGGYIHLWTGPNGITSSAPTFCVTFPGTYQIIVTDANGCTAETSFTIAQEILDVIITADGSTVCSGSSVTLTAITGFPGSYIYQWSDGSNEQSIMVNSAGQWDVSVTDANGCFGFASYTLSEGEVLVEITGNEIFCEGTSSILDAGAGFSAYEWSDGSANQTLEVTASGTYSVTVTDINGCTGIDEKTVFELAELQPAISGNLTICPGNSTTLDAGFYETYEWSTGASSSSISVNEIGTYSVTVTDANACSGSASVEVGESNPVQVAITGVLEFCSGGSSTITASSGFSSYLWTNNVTTQSITVNSSGSYSVTVTDASGCTGLAAITVIENPFPTAAFSGDFHLCDGETATFEVTPGYESYQWFDLPGGSHPNERTVDAPGVYEVLVTDLNGCTNISEVEVNLSSFSSFVNANPTSACGLDDGSIDINSTGNFAPHTYEWSNGSTSQFLNNLASGEYIVTITDEMGCTQVESATVTSPSAISGNVVSQIDPLCNGNTTGSIEVTGENGTPPYSYEWSNGVNTSLNDNLPAGDYTLTITDAEPGSCPFIENYTLTEPTALVIGSSSITDVSCENNSDGSILINASGGQSIYTYEWNNGVNTQNLIDIPAGNYIVTVTDSNGCSVTEEYTVDNAPGIVISNAVITNVSCFGGNDGAINITITGGTPPFAYNWSNVSTAEDINNLSAGNYSVTIFDGNGCEFVSDLFDVLMPTQLDVQLMTENATCEEPGNITAEVSGGTPDYFYEWSNGENTATIENLPGGIYTVTVFDDNGCVAVATTLVESVIDLEVTSTLADCDENNGTATAIISGGATNPVFSWSNGGTGDSQTNLAPGFYSVTVTDLDNGCQTHDNVEVKEDPNCFVKISGFVFIDQLVPDCNIDVSSQPVANILVQLSDGQLTFTNSDGYYEFTSETPDAYAITLIYNNMLYEGLCVDPIVVNALTFGAAYTDNNFYFQYSNILEHDIKLKISKQNARPGFTQYVRICVMNVGGVPVSGVLTFVHDEIQEYSSASPMEDNYDSGTRTFTWNYDGIPPGTVWIYYAYLYTPPTTPLGTPLEYSIKAEPLEGDLTPFNNEAFCIVEVTGSYDPNDKQVEPAGVGEEGIISMADSLLSYQIRFQNTGTDTAFTVVIRDQLDIDLDVTTLVPGPASHPYSLDILDGNILEFTFENIMLPDSNVNEPASHGFVFFDIETKSGSPYGTVIENTAEIYFDFNAPIITNTVSNIIQMIDGTNDLEQPGITIQVLPNPLKQTGVLEYQLPIPEEITIELLDLKGRVLKTIMKKVKLSQGNYSIPIILNDLPGGVYIVKMSTATGIVNNQKVISLK